MRTILALCAFLIGFSAGTTYYLAETHSAYTVAYSRLMADERELQGYRDQLANE